MALPRLVSDACIYLHIGPPKTGSTYLQDVVWRNREAIREQGLTYPAAHDNEHFLAANDVQDGVFVSAELPEAEGVWGRVASRTREQAGRSLLSHELLALSRPEHIHRIVESLHPVPVEVVVMARCLADVLPSIYQEKVKQRDPEVSWPEFLRDSQRPGGIWAHRLGPLISRWRAAGRIHVVTVPPPSAPRRWLLERFGRVVGFDPTDLDVRDADTNDSLDDVDVVLLQHLVRRTRATLSWHEHQDLISKLLPLLRAAGRPRRSLGMPASSCDWMQHEAAEAVRAIVESDCTVYGDLADLQPRPDCFSDEGPETVQPDDVLAAAIDALRLALAAPRHDR